VKEIMTKQAANTNERAAEPNSAQHEDRTPGRLQDQIAVVTGASSGIGRAIALALAKEGAQTYLLGRELETIKGAAAWAGLTSPKTFAFRADLNRDPDIYALKAELEGTQRRVDILIHSAGQSLYGEHANAAVADFDAQYRTNVRAPYLLTQALLPMLRVGPGQIVFINSSVGLKAKARAGQYSSTKHALKAIADSLREEVNGDGIRVLSVYPGRTATPRAAELFESEGRPYRPELLMQPEDVAAMVIHSLCLARTAEVTEISMRPMLKSY
jgi:short-subunit dehydrogenase